MAFRARPAQRKHDWSFKVKWYYVAGGGVLVVVIVVVLSTGVGANIEGRLLGWLSQNAR